MNRLTRKISLKGIAKIGCCIVLFGSASLYLLVHPMKREAMPAIDARLNDIQSRVINLQNDVKKPAEKIDLSAINQDFNKLTTLIEQFKSNDNAKINENQAELTNKLDAIHQVINSLDKKQHPIKYLPLTALPFHVISIDSIQQVSVASVTYDYKTIPLEKNDSLAGWTVMQIDYGKQRVELENSDKERVLVTLDMTQDESHV